ncbi:MAG: hypothetical protein HOU81_13860 [Hamadaea sp.]|uniref:hypothetical protein n=1 Tax=Hamadaea sp. TaxID=2024425 RepID=UPI00179AD7C5|nr:hypothetical protein [Hamadaea sp.]NUR71904.1 hypothetical protein [Hamadaea sp.]NUT17964.1 hypothetical protein [Hamadaea sp.]
MAENNAAPWTLVVHPTEVAACRGAIRFDVRPGEWADPDLADLVAPPIVVRAQFANGRHRAVEIQPQRIPHYVPTWRDLAGALAPA